MSTLHKQVQLSYQSIFTIPPKTASDRGPASATENEQTGKHVQPGAAYFVLQRGSATSIASCLLSQEFTHFLLLHFLLFSAKHNTIPHSLLTILFMPNILFSTEVMFDRFIVQNYHHT